MHLTWLGHSAFRLEIDGQVLLIDPYLTGNPAFPAERRAEAVTGATAILVTHGHADHVGDAVILARDLRIPVCGVNDLVELIAQRGGIDIMGFNRGGTIRLGAVGVTLVAASHSSSFDSVNPPLLPAGSECGFMIAGEGRTVYVSGDTDVMADMGVFQALHEPQIGILACGGHYTMDMTRAAWAARTFFRFQTVIPCHYRTFPILAQSAEPLRAALPGVQVLTPEVMERITL